MRYRALAALCAASVVSVMSLAQPQPPQPPPQPPPAGGGDANPTAKAATPSPAPATKPAADGPRSPQLLGDDGRPVAGVRVASADVKAVVRGPLAEATLVLTFRNSTDRVLGGELTFPLPDGATVAGYGLDVNGAMVDGVAVEKQQARVIYEKEMNKSVDPGLVEHVVGNNFRTRLYPIPAKGTRTLKVTYVADLIAGEGGKGATLTLPMGLGDDLEALDLSVAVEGATEPPTVRGGSYTNKPFDGNPRGFYLRDSLKSAKAVDALTVSLPDVPASGVVVQRRTRDPISVEEMTEVAKSNPPAVEGRPGVAEHYFVLTDTPDRPKQEASTALKNGRVLVAWDASLSRAWADKSRELAVLEQSLARLGHPVVDVALLRNDVEWSAAAGTGGPDGTAKLIAFLKAVRYDGGTNLGALSIPKDGTALFPGRRERQDYDLALLFSDGLSTVGQATPAKVEVPVYAVSADPSADHAGLRSLCQRSGGAYLNLNRESDAAAVAAVGQPPFSVIAVESNPPGRVLDVTPGVGSAVGGRVTVAGRLMAPEANVTLVYGFGKTETSRRTFTLKQADATDGLLVPRYWAQQKANELAQAGDGSREDLAKLGKAFGLVTPATSLLVLETVDQYVQYGVVPPKSRPDVYQAFQKQVEGRRVEQAKTKEEKIQQVLGMWNARRAWWATEFKYPKDLKVAPAGSTPPPITAVARPATMPAMNAPDLTPEQRRIEMSTRAFRAREHTAQARQAISTGRLTDALDHYVQATELDPANQEALAGRNDVLSRLGGPAPNERARLQELALPEARGRIDDSAPRAAAAEPQRQEAERLRTALRDRPAERSTAGSPAAGASATPAAAPATPAPSPRPVAGPAVADPAEAAPARPQTPLSGAPPAVATEQRLDRTATGEGLAQRQRGVEPRGQAELRRDVQATGRFGSGGGSGGGRAAGQTALPADSADAYLLPAAGDRRANGNAAGRRLVDGRIPEDDILRYPADWPDVADGLHDRADGSRIAIQTWDPNTPYLAAMKAVPADKAYDAYLAQRDKYAKSPAFYFDCADFLVRTGQTAAGVRVLTDVAELKLEDARLIRVAAHRLHQIGQTDLAIDLFERVLKLRPEEPQSYRDLALALTARADGVMASPAAGRSADATSRAGVDYGRALELLDKVVTGNWDRFQEIEVIALTEANQIAARLGRTPELGAVPVPIDPRLRGPLDCDVRIVLTWDADMTDIDLWVEEPSGEVCMYNHNRTQIGGAMSRDFTQGYGPEEYLLRRTMPGQYTVKANFYGSRQQELTGPCTVQATVIIDFGRPTEKRQAMTLRLANRQETVTVGTVTLK